MEELLEQNNPEEKPKAPYGTASLVCSIIGLALLIITWLMPDDDEFETLSGLIILTGIAMSIVGMVLGIVGSKKIKNRSNEFSNSSALLAGKIMGIVGVACWGFLMLIGTIYILLVEGIEGFL